MSVKRKSFSADFKDKLVLEVLEGEKTVNAHSLYLTQSKPSAMYGVYGVSLGGYCPLIPYSNRLIKNKKA